MTNESPLAMLSCELPIIYRGFSGGIGAFMQCTLCLAPATVPGVKWVYWGVIFVFLLNFLFFGTDRANVH